MSNWKVDGDLIITKCARARVCVCVLLWSEILGIYFFEK